MPMRPPGEFPHQICGRYSKEQFDTLQAICDGIEADTLKPARLIDALRLLCDSPYAKRLAKKARA